MPVTTAAYFTTASQTSTAAPDWADLDNILAAADKSRTENPTGSSEDSETVQLDTPLSGAEIPPGHTITNIRIVVNATSSGGSGTRFITFLNIAGGDNKQSTIGGGGASDEVFDGDMAYWNITEAQAREFANGTEPLEYLGRWIDPVSTGQWIDVYYVTAQFTHVSTQVNLPTLF